MGFAGEIIPKAETENALETMRGQNRGTHVPLQRADPLAVSPFESRGPAEAEPDREDDSMHDPDEVDGHDPAFEASVIRARSIPVGPTNQHRDDHEAAGHVPYRSWCRARVAGRGRNISCSAPAQGHGPCLVRASVGTSDY